MKELHKQDLYVLKVCM